MTLGALTVNIVANLDRFTPNLRQSQSLLGRIGKGISALKGGIVGLGAAAAAAIGVKLLNTWKSFADEVDKIGHAAERLGVTTQALSALAYAADLSESSLDGLIRGMTMMQKNLGSGSNAISDTLTKMGLSVGELQNMQADKAFLTIADALNQLPTPAEKTAAAMQLFGRAGADLMPLLGEGSEKIREMMAEAEKMGVVFDKSMAEKVDKANDSLTRMKGALGGLARQIAIKSADFIQRVANRLSGNVPNPYEAILATMTDKEFQRLQRDMAAHKHRRFGHDEMYLTQRLGLDPNKTLVDVRQLIAAVHQRQDKMNEAIAASHQKQGIADPIGDWLKDQKPFADLIKAGFIGLGAGAGGFGRAESSYGAMAPGMGFGMMGMNMAMAANMAAMQSQPGKRMGPLEALTGGSREAYVASRENMRPTGDGKHNLKEIIAKNSEKAAGHWKRIAAFVEEWAAGTGTNRIIAGESG